MRKSLISFVLFGSAAWGAVSLAQDAELFSKLDANGDGQLTADEAGAEKKAIFDRLLANGDKNGDGKLTKEEFAAGLKDQAPQNPQPGGFGDQGRGPGQFNLEEMLKRVDKDGDKKISKEEAPERMKENFARLDANSDGFLDGRELARMAEMMQGNPPRPGERRPEGSPEGRTPEGRPGDGGFPPFARLFDTNKDGELSAEEIAAAADALKKLDANQDGKLTGTELIAAVGEPGRGAPPLQGARGGDMVAAMMERFKQADANGDGKISKDEAPDRLKERFDGVDANKDGFLDEAELRKMMEQMRQQFGGDRRPDGARPEGDRPREGGERRPEGDRPRAEGDRPRGNGERRPEGDRPREGDRPNRRPE